MEAQPFVSRDHRTRAYAAPSAVRQHIVRSVQTILAAETGPGWVTSAPTLIAAALVITDYGIKFAAIGILPSNRKPSSAMAWLILILIIPFAGFFLFWFLGRTNLGKGRLRRQREADEAIRTATDRLPAVEVTGPSYLASMATLNLNLGSLPLQTGNRVDLI